MPMIPYIMLDQIPAQICLDPVNRARKKITNITMLIVVVKIGVKEIMARRWDKLSEWYYVGMTEVVLVEKKSS